MSFDKKIECLVGMKARNRYKVVNDGSCSVDAALAAELDIYSVKGEQGTALKAFLKKRWFCFLAW